MRTIAPRPTWFYGKLLFGRTILRSTTQNQTSAPSSQHGILMLQFCLTMDVNVSDVFWCDQCFDWVYSSIVRYNFHPESDPMDMNATHVSDKTSILTGFIPKIWHYLTIWFQGLDQTLCQLEQCFSRKSSRSHEKRSCLMSDGALLSHGIALFHVWHGSHFVRTRNVHNQYFHTRISHPHKRSCFAVLRKYWPVNLAELDKFRYYGTYTCTQGNHGSILDFPW